MLFIDVLTYYRRHYCILNLISIYTLKLFRTLIQKAVQNTRRKYQERDNAISNILPQLSVNTVHGM